jgi:hypothetical protein
MHLLSAGVVPPCNLRHDGAGREALCHDAGLLLVAPAPPPSAAIRDPFNAANRSRLRVVIMVDHMVHRSKQGSSPCPLTPTFGMWVQTTAYHQSTGDRDLPRRLGFVQSASAQDVRWSWRRA